MAKFGEYKKEELEHLQSVLVSMVKDFNDICKKHNINYFVMDGTAIGAVRHENIIPWDDDVDIRMLREDYEKLEKVISKECDGKYYIVDYTTDNTYPYLFKKICLNNTRFTLETEYELGSNFGIFIDLYIMEYVPDDEITRNKVLKRAWYYQHVGILALFKKPIILFKGIKGTFVKIACVIIHYFLKLFRINAFKCYSKAERILINSVDGKTNTVAFPFDTLPLTNVVFVSDIFPLKKKKFGNTYVMLPKEYDKLLRQQFGDYMKLPKVEDRKNHHPKILDFDTSSKKKGK